MQPEPQEPAAEGGSANAGANDKLAADVVENAAQPQGAVAPAGGDKKRRRNRRRGKGAGRPAADAVPGGLVASDADAGTQAPQGPQPPRRT